MQIETEDGQGAKASDYKADWLWVKEKESSMTGVGVQSMVVLLLSLLGRHRRWRRRSTRKPASVECKINCVQLKHPEWLYALKPRTSICAVSLCSCSQARICGCTGSFRLSADITGAWSPAGVIWWENKDLTSSLGHLAGGRGRRKRWTGGKVRVEGKGQGTGVIGHRGQ